MLQSLWINYTKRNRGNVHPSRTHLCVCVCVKLTLTLTHVIAVIELLTVLAEDVHQRPGLQLTWKQSTIHPQEVQIWTQYFFAYIDK